MAHANLADVKTWVATNLRCRLAGVNVSLARANLSDADLVDADLSDADLSN